MVADTKENVDRIRNWTPVDEDLDGVTGAAREVAIRTRKDFGLAVDSVRCDVWHDPEGVDVFADVPYLPDGDGATAQGKAHCLDVYLPHDALLRGGTSLPVIVDIHGGGFVYGYKDLNRNFGTHLAARGFAVFSLGYRLAPTADFRDQLADIMHGLAWLERHLADYPVDPDTIVIAGDSAGATLGEYATAILNGPELAKAFGFGPGTDVLVPAITPAAAVFFSGLFDVDGIVHHEGDVSILPYLDAMGGTFFDTTVERVPAELLSARGLAASGLLPPVFLTTSSDDFLEHESLFFAGHLRSNGVVCEIHDVVPPKGLTLGHVFPVGQTWLPESEALLDGIREFVYGRMRPSYRATT
ncbi:alpha/beta hydrolase [Bifidobacterium platyrrhinorum]|uniref:Alpha/beta hydrolase fold domain-containing protein n=1 Tax=Bifidobacterium platyrrhinorum TaxID=2661628 RepID=A0A6L9SS81_9BIFI|nr:alpha/beta hydrolase [Bifidobacterium platyrrhinorum]NEG54909.1 alpha/beta hydrolase fold domain-containing protein [Bifidobacterium platyrrhinorum]